MEYAELFNFRFGFNTPKLVDKASRETLTIERNPLIYALSVKNKELPLRVQAQEHYVEVTTCLGTELILYQFGQALIDLESFVGLQVHRSYWVASENIVGWSKQKNNIQLELKFGNSVPVSRRFEQNVREQFASIEE